MGRKSKKGNVDGKQSHVRPSPAALFGSSGPRGPAGSGDRPAHEAMQLARAGKEGVPRPTNGAPKQWKHLWVSQREPRPCSAPRDTAGPCFRPRSAAVFCRAPNPSPAEEFAALLRRRRNDIFPNSAADGAPSNCQRAGTSTSS